MGLKPEISLPVALGTAGVVYGIFQNATPPIADIRSLEKNNVDVSASERTATGLATALVSGISLIAKDMTIFIVGGITIIGLSWMHRHANAVDNVTKRAVDVATMREATPRVTQEEAPELYSVPAVSGYDMVI